MKSPIAMAVLTAAVLAIPGAFAGAHAAAAPVPAAPAPPVAPGAAPAGAAALAKTAKSPIDITSDQSETHSTDCTAIFTGSPEALQETSRLRADIMIAHQEVLKKDAKPKPGATASNAQSGACGDTVSLEAKGNVYYAAADGRRVHGDNAYYDYATTTITVTGDVTAVNGQDVMRGTKMVYNTQTGEGHMEGVGKGAGAKNRTRGVFYPKDANTDASASGTAAGTTLATPGDAAPAKPKKKKAATSTSAPQS